MKRGKMFITLIAGLFILGGLSICFAAITVNVGVNATIDSQLSLSSYIRSSPGDAGPYEDGSADATSIDFGPLNWDDTNGIWTASKHYTVFLIANTSGRAYTIKQTCTGLVSGSDNLNGSFVVVPDYRQEDKFCWGSPQVCQAQGPQPSEDVVESAGLATATNKVIYTGNAGLSRIIRAYYGLATGQSGTVGTPITGDQPAGIYGGTVIFTVTIN